MRQFIGLGSKRPITQQESIFHSAAWPFEPKQRLDMAILWLKEACIYGYAPAHLDMAKLCMRKTISSELRVPEHVRNLSPKRYTYSSKAEYDVATAQAEDTGRDGADGPNQAIQGRGKDEVNPHYSPQHAKQWLREIFYCYMAHQEMRKTLEEYRRDVRRGTTSKQIDEDEVITDTSLSEKGQPEHITKWFRFREVREQYEDRVQDLWLEAKDICDRKKWNIYDDQGGLIYRAKL
jgi:hypothetical protein